MLTWIESLPIVVAGIVVVGGIVVATIVIGNLIDRVFPRGMREQHNDLAGFILAVIGVVYAVLLAFVAIGVWERFELAEIRSYQEAGALSSVYRDVNSFPAQSGTIHAMLREYVDLVLNEEWEKMRRGGQSERADRLLERIDAAVRQLPVKTPAQQDVQDQILQAMETTLSGRDARLSMDASGINGIMWAVLIIGASVTVGFTFLFGFKHTLMQQMMIGSLSSIIGLVLFLTAVLDFPFRGGITVDPEAFRNALETFNVIGR